MESRSVYFSSITTIQHAITCESNVATIESKNGLPPNQQVVYFNDGTEATINQIVNTIVASDQVRKHVFHVLDSGGEARMAIAYCRDIAWQILDRFGARREITALIIILEVAKERTSVPLKHGKAFEYQVAFGEGKYWEKGAVSISALEKEGQPTTIAIRLATGELHISQTNGNIDMKVMQQGGTI